MYNVLFDGTCAMLATEKIVESSGGLKCFDRTSTSTIAIPFLNII